MTGPSAFDWASLPPHSLVVDVGGGIGSTSMMLAETFEHLRFVVQDREVVVEHGEKVRKQAIKRVICTDMGLVS